MAKKSTRRPKPARKKASVRTHKFSRGLYGWITHTDLSSHDPGATKTWCAKVLGWKFGPSFPGPGGDYHLFAYSARGGGGIRKVLADETPGSLPHVHVADCSLSFARAIDEGAEVIMPPTRIMAGVTIAVVRAPGGIAIGLSGP